MHWALLRGRKRLLGDMVKMENLKVIICFEIVPLLELLCKCLMVSLCDELSMTEIFWSRHLIHPQWVEHFRNEFVPSSVATTFFVKAFSKLFSLLLYLIQYHFQEFQKKSGHCDKGLYCMTTRSNGPCTTWQKRRKRDFLHILQP